MADIKSHHQAIGKLYDIEEVTEDDLESIHKHSRNYRLGMLGIRVLSVVQAFSVYTRYYAGHLPAGKEGKAVVAILGFIFIGDSLNYRWFHKSTLPIVEKYANIEKSEENKFEDLMGYVNTSK